MPATTKKTGANTWALLVPEQPDDTFTATREGRSYVVRAGDNVIGEASTLPGAHKVAAGYQADLAAKADLLADGDDADPGPAVNVVDSTITWDSEGAGEVWLWLEHGTGPSAGTVSLLRQYRHEPGPRTVLRVPAKDGPSRLAEQTSVYEAQGRTVHPTPFA
jgi:hypothetical protein